MKLKKQVYIIILITVIFSACKKYPDGPLISFRSKLNRIEGKWNVDKFYVDGIDSTESFNQNLALKIEFTKKKYGSKHSYAIYYESASNNIYLYGYWYFKEENIISTILNESIVYEMGPFTANSSSMWTIIRLTNKEFNLSTSWIPNCTSCGNHTYLLKLIKE